MAVTDCRGSLSALIKCYEPDESKHQQALDAFEEIISDYQNAIPPAVSQTRKELKSLVTALEESIDTLGKLQPQSLSLFCDALDGPRGAVTEQLKHAKDVAAMAHASAMALPNKTPKSDINVLAYEVAHVMQTILKMSVSLTRDTDENIKGNHGGAAYCNILRQIMECAGETPATDLYPLMSRGVELLENPLGNEHSPDLK